MLLKVLVDLRLSSEIWVFHLLWKAGCYLFLSAYCVLLVLLVLGFVEGGFCFGEEILLGFSAIIIIRLFYCFVLWLKEI